MKTNNMLKHASMTMLKGIAFKTLISCCFVFFYGLSYGQLTNFEDKTIPSSPTTAALGQYGSTPIDLSSGQANISIPIHTIRGADLSLSVAFSYRAGVKLKETSPYTGHGWSMLAGGVITRSINGAVDPTPRAPNILTTGWTVNEALDVHQQHLDASPDVFNYNFMGYAGQFVLEDDFQSPYYIGEQRNWSLQGPYNGSIHFGDEITIVAEDGTKYIFSSTETTTVSDQINYFGDDVIVAWHLTEIISAKNKEKIVLNYYTEVFGKPILKNNTLLLNPLSKTYHVDPAINQNISFNAKKLSEIVLYKDNTPVSKVKFEANTFRNDLLGSSHALSKISIFDDPQSTQPLKYFDIDIDNVNNERLFLRSIQEYAGNGNSAKPPYQFEYISEASLPPRLAYKSDYWGYYSQQNGTEFPYSDKVKWRQARSKEPSSTAKYGSLDKVTFPTGGSNHFFYENNVFNKEDWDYTTKELKLVWLGNRWEKNYQPSSTSESFNFSLPTDQFVKLDMTMSLIKGMNRVKSTLLNDEISDYRISILNTNTNQEVFSVYFDYDPGSNDGIAMHVRANNFVSYKYLNQELYAEDPNDIPQSQKNATLDYRSGSVLNWFYKSSANLAAYDYYDPHINTGSDLQVGESLDRFLYLDLTAGSYTAIINTSTIDNDMINQSEVSLKISHHYGNLINKNCIGGGIRIESQLIDDGDEERTIFYDYVVHDSNGLPTSQSSGQISEEPNTILYTPDANFIHYTYEHQGNGLYAWMQNSIDLEPSSLWTRVGGDRDPNYPSQSISTLSHIETTTPLYSIQSEPFQLHNSRISYREVKVTNGEGYDNAGFSLHKFHEFGSRAYQTFLDTFVDANGTNTFGFTKYGGSSASITKGWPFNGHLEININHTKPQSISQYKFNGIGLAPTLVAKEIYEYDYIVKDRRLTSNVQAVAHVVFVGTSFFERQYSLLKSKETIQYDQNGNNPITTKVDYVYNLPVHNFTARVITTNSQGDKIVKRTKYVPDYLSNTSIGNGASITIENLLDNHILWPVEEQIWKGNDTDGYNLIDGTLSIYDKISSSNASNKLYQPIKFLKLETESLTNSGITATDFINTAGFNSLNWLNNTAYDYAPNVAMNYDDNGNLNQISKDEDVAIMYIWGYNEQYPIAKIENFETSQITATLQNLINAAVVASNNDDSLNDENTLRTALSNLRNSSSLDNALLTTYTYDPLIGITSQTNSNKITTFYVYDNISRLYQIKNQYGHVLKQYNYNYGN